MSLRRGSLDHDRRGEARVPRLIAVTRGNATIMGNQQETIMARLLPPLGLSSTMFDFALICTAGENTSIQGGSAPNVTPSANGRASRPALTWRSLCKTCLKPLN
ncbi:hypothetical protein RRG08_040385 [Elysia crispata]|uniref:Uncharacterized protein n=1 Tax=Elysia crispata TaxID=231223 RepID=A0AAE1A2D5_9GAST|nr:hypothetical protein RRG08_040385 [Elysia crispata]